MVEHTHSPRYSSSTHTPTGSPVDSPGMVHHLTHNNNNNNNNNNAQVNRQTRGGRQRTGDSFPSLEGVMQSSCLLKQVGEELAIFEQVRAPHTRLTLGKRRGGEGRGERRGH